MRAESREPRAETSDGERRARLIRCFWTVAHVAGLSEARAYEIGSEAVGRTLVKDFGLTTCTKVELIRCVDALKRAVGQAVGEHRAASREPRRQRPPRLPADDRKVVRIASLGALQMLRALVEELRLGPDECAGIFRRACGAAHPRTAVQVGKCIEAVKAIRRRKLQPQMDADGRR